MTTWRYDGSACAEIVGCHAFAHDYTRDKMGEGGPVRLDPGTEHKPGGIGLPAELQRWLMSLAVTHTVLAPSSRAGDRVFEEMPPAGALRLYLPQNRTLVPFKKALLPAEETLLSFEGGTVLPEPPPRDTVLFGLHICELSADRLLTSVMESGSPDFPYLSRRRKTITIGAPCKRTEGCFCEKTGHDHVGPGDYDLFLAPAPGDESGGGWRLVAGSETGARLAADAPLTLAEGPADFSAPAPMEARDTNRWPIGELPDRIRQSLGAVMWEELAERCLGCGNCTIVCPLCYCFYTRDETGLDPSASRRLRQWDSCQLVGFARVAGGHNFREARSERIWYRFSHKFMRMPEAFGSAGCTGCGACLHFCPAAIDPGKAIEGILEVTRAG